MSTEDEEIIATVSDSDEDTKFLRVYKEDRDWLKENRGAGNIADKVHEVIDFWRKKHKK